jgi:hypothetical protein
METFNAFFGVPQQRGGFMLTEQMIITAVDYEHAHKQAMYHRKRGEQVYLVEHTK